MCDLHVNNNNYRVERKSINAHRFDVLKEKQDNDVNFKVNKIEEMVPNVSH